MKGTLYIYNVSGELFELNWSKIKEILLSKRPSSDNSEEKPNPPPDDQTPATAEVKGYMTERDAEFAAGRDNSTTEETTKSTQSSDQSEKK